jgi:hypothetical protein
MDVRGKLHATIRGYEKKGGILTAARTTVKVGSKHEADRPTNHAKRLVHDLDIFPWLLWGNDLSRARLRSGGGWVGMKLSNGKRFDMLWIWKVYWVGDKLLRRAAINRRFILF